MTKYSILILLLCCSAIGFSQEIKNKKHIHAHVKGECGMCTERIEAASTIQNISKGTYDIESQTLEIDFDSLQTSSTKILQNIAIAGHDNELYRADDAVYEALPDCCHYERENAEATKDAHTSHDHSEANSLQDVVVKTEAKALSLSKNSTDLTYSINKKELLRAACCNLAESFETNATVDVSFTNAVLGTQQIKMLGLDQKYTLFSKEIMPEFRGLASTFGLNFIPGKWIESIQLTKGASTVTNGYEAITGQINTQMLKFTGENEETALNLYANNNSRLESNFTNISKLSEHWGNSMMFHASTLFDKQDHNHDHLIDAPLSQQFNFMDILTYQSENGYEGLASIHLLTDEKTAGSKHFNEREHALGNTYYGTNVKTQRAQIFLKTGYVFPDKPHQSIGWQNQVTFHQQDSYFGQRIYDGIQKSVYSNLLFENNFSEKHTYKVGASFTHDSYEEWYTTQKYTRNENTIGAFAEYTYKDEKNLTIVSGIRIDHHNTIGTQFIPRINAKYDITKKTILRASAGKGIRIASVFAENQQYFASQRTVQISHTEHDLAYGLQPEIAWNYGISLQQEFTLFKTKNSLIADVYRTDFQNQVVVDVENPRLVQFYNLDGKSFANSFQIQWDFTPSKQWETRFAYKYYDVKSTFSGEEKQVPFMPTHRAFATVNYKTKESANKGFWDANFTVQYVGEQRLPSTAANSVANQRPEFTESYFVMNAQIAKYFGTKIRLYLGAENIGNYTQDNPILSARNPFDAEFDASFVYAPIMGTNYYIGIDLKF